MSAFPANPAQLHVKVSHNPLAFIYRFFTPTITIDGTSYQRNWGDSTFPVSPGRHEVSVSYPWLFAAECGKNTVTFNLQPGETKTVNYCAGLIRYLPGKISVS